MWGVMDKEFLSVKEVSQIFSIHINTVYTWIQKGFIVSIRIGNKPKSPYRISRKAVEEIHNSILKEMASKVKKP